MKKEILFFGVPGFWCFGGSPRTCALGHLLLKLKMTLSSQKGGLWHTEKCLVSVCSGARTQANVNNILCYSLWIRLWTEGKNDPSQATGTIKSAIFFSC